MNRKFRIPEKEEMVRLLNWGGYRLLLTVPAIGLYTLRQLSRLALHITSESERLYGEIILQPFDTLIWGEEAVIEAKLITQVIEPISDLLSAAEEKELMIIGEKGTGKSTLAQYLGYSLGGHIKVYEPEGTPNDWSGLEVVGKGEDWESINASMKADLEHISNQMVLRREKGDAALAGSDRVIIGEEYPEIAAKCDTAEEWLDRHARRGRKARVRLILLSQYDRVAAWRLEGRSDLLDCFYRLRLGKKAWNHAKSLKRDDLMDWLKHSRAHALLDDDPVILPDYREMTRVIQQAAQGYTQVSSRLLSGYEKQPEVPPEATDFQGFQALEAGSGESPESLLDGILGAFDAGKSDDWIAKNLLGATGGNSYYKAKDRVARIRAKVEG
jgi:hypothetical protein